MRRRGVIFKDFKDIKSGDSSVSAMSKLNSNIKLLLEVLADLRVNTSSDPKQALKDDSN